MINNNNFIEFTNNINILNKYFSYLRKKKRGDLNVFLDELEIDKFENTNIKNIQKLVTDTLKNNYRCFECGFTYTKIEDYFEKLPFITLNKDTDSLFITLFCDGCREEAMKRLLNRFNKEE